MATVWVEKFREKKKEGEKNGKTVESWWEVANLKQARGG